MGTPEPPGLLETALLTPFGTPDLAGLVPVALLAPKGIPDPALVAGPVGGLWVFRGSLLTDPVF